MKRHAAARQMLFFGCLVSENTETGLLMKSGVALTPLVSDGIFLRLLSGSFLEWGS